MADLSVSVPSVSHAIEEAEKAPLCFGAINYLEKQMNDTEKEAESQSTQNMNTWLKSEVRLTIPRYWLVIAGGTALVLLLVALD